MSICRFDAGNNKSDVWMMDVSTLRSPYLRIPQSRVEGSSRINDNNMLMLYGILRTSIDASN